jgi:hypothetical protein
MATVRSSRSVRISSGTVMKNRSIDRYGTIIAATNGTRFSHEKWNEGTEARDAAANSAPP